MQNECKWNVVCPTLTLNKQWPAAWHVAEWHGVQTVLPATHAFIHEWNEPSCMHFRKHSPDGVARARWHTSWSAYYSSIDLERMKGWVGLVGWPYSGCFTHISGHPSASSRAWDRESSTRYCATQPTKCHWKPIYLASKGERSRSRGTKTASEGFDTPVSADFF